MEQRLDGHVVIVTGASQGLGRAIAQEMSAAGAAVVAAARRKRLLDELVAELTATGGTAAAVVADVAETDSLAALVATTTERFGKVDTVVNNAAYEGPIAPLLELDEAELHRALDVNLLAVWRLAHLVLPGMMERRYGRIINIMGPIPEQPAPLHTVVGASKGAVLGLTRALAAEVAPFEITVNALCAGAIRGTEMSGRMLGGYAEFAGITLEEVEAMALQRSPQMRFQELAEVAAVAVFLASPAASSITAQSVRAAGGLFV
jgi:NAD(P)-dependent dehydrogenase (short-subunit alcohol dehydrogenase family)